MKKGFTAILLLLLAGGLMLLGFVWYFWMQKSIVDVTTSTPFSQANPLDAPTPELSDQDDLEAEVNTLLQVELDNIEADLGEDFTELTQ